MDIGLMTGTVPASEQRLDGRTEVGLTVDEAAYRPHKSTLAILMAGHNLRRLNRMNQTFAGDLDLPIALASIGLHVLRRILAEAPPLAPEEIVSRTTTSTCPISRVAEHTGLPRETARRKVKTLITRGWLRELAPGSVALSIRAVEYFGYEYNRQFLDDFLWTADRLREVLAYDDDALRRADLRRSFAMALTTREEEQGAHLFSTQFTPPTATQSEVLGHRVVRVAELLGSYWERHLHRLRAAFGGDLHLPLLLGEVGHYSVGALMYHRGAGLATLDAMLADVEQSRELLAKVMRPCNAHSLSMVTQVPGSSVRRKLAVLVAKDWLATTPDGAVFVTDKPAVVFEALNIAMLQDFLDTDVRLRRLLEP
jgi:hypothetical protein